jgi:polyribonucleotide nucleotidyltransferase
METGLVAKQAHGSVMVTCEGTVVLATVVAEESGREGIDFLPLTVDYRERTYAAGKIPGGFFKREGRPGDKETLTCRLIDRPLRPLFPDGYNRETQILITVLSVDQVNDPDILSIIGSSAALYISPLPFCERVGAVRVGRCDGQLIANPSYQQMENSSLNLVVVGTADHIVMVEGGGDEVSEQDMVEALNFGQNALRPIIEAQEELRRLAGVEKEPAPEVRSNHELEVRVKEMVLEEMREALVVPGKMERQKRIDAIRDRAVEALGDEENDNIAEIESALDKLEKEEVRKLISAKGLRADGRGLKEIRPIWTKVGMLPRTHGSALFTRGETQALAVATLGTSIDEQRIDDLGGKSTKTFMLHYNFLPFSVGEARFLRNPGRREIGHGALAERAVTPMLPSHEDFPYTIRVVSDILESNGSSSMASVCGASMALMDAGVPIKSAVAGIAMGLIKEGDNSYILSDILGLEDHVGDMDFKVAGTRKGITAIQMDVKIAGVSMETMGEALEQAREGRLFILDRMDETISQPRPDISPYAPRIITVKVKPDKVREVIGPGGKTIRSITERTGVTIDIEDDGTVTIASVDESAAREAVDIINKLVEEAEVGKIYMGTVKKIVDFGAFVEIIPGTDGLLHISQIAEHRVRKVEDELKEGDEVMVKVLDVDRNGKIKLSRKEAMKEEPKGSN